MDFNHTRELVVFGSESKMPLVQESKTEQLDSVSLNTPLEVQQFV